MRTLAATTLLLGLFLAGAAAADETIRSAPPSWMQDGKAGRYMFNLKLAPAIGAKGPNDDYPNYKPNAFALELDFGVALDAGRHAYLVFPFQFHANDQGVIVMVPIGFQYDVSLPVKGLYLTPRLVVGYAAVVPTQDYVNGVPTSTTHSGFVAPELGIKYVFAKRWNIGFEPFSLPVFIGSATNPLTGASKIVTAVAYRLMFYGGVNF